MIIRAIALVFLLQAVSARAPIEKCEEGEYFQNFIWSCVECSRCPSGTYVERPCSRTKDTECIDCGVVDHDNEDYQKKCSLQVDQDFKDAIEKQIRGQLERTMALKEVIPLEDDEDDDSDAQIEDVLRKIEGDREAAPQREMIDDSGPWEGEDDEDIDKDDDVAFLLSNINDRRPRIGDGAKPMETIEIRRRPIRPRLGLVFGDRMDDDDESDEIKPVEVDETSDSDDDDEDEDEEYPVLEPMVDHRREEADELARLEEEEAHALVGFEEADDDDDKPPFVDLLPLKVRKRPIPAVRLLDPLFNLEKEEEKLKIIDEFEEDSDELDSDEPLERKVPEIIDFKIWMQRRGGVRFEEDDFNDIVETEEQVAVKSPHEGHNHWLRALFLTGFILLFIGLVCWVGQLRRRNRAYRCHMSKLRYLSPEEREVIERAAGFLQKPRVTIYENQVYEAA